MSLTDENFKSQHTGKCDLLIKISGGNFSYAVVDQVQDQVKILLSSGTIEQPHEMLKKAFSENPVFNFSFRKVKVSVETANFTFVPAEAYSEELLPVYGKFNLHSETNLVQASHIRSAGIRNVLSVGTEVKQTLNARFKDALLLSQAEPFIEAALKFYFKPLALQAFIQINPSSFELLITEGKKIKFYNLFENSSVDEFNYFLLFAITQLELDSPKIAVILSGEISFGDDRYKRIQKYFTDINFADCRKLIRIPEAAIKDETHRFFSLLSLNVCA